jgi:hypothetical protein
MKFIYWKTFFDPYIVQAPEHCDLSYKGQLIKNLFFKFALFFMKDNILYSLLSSNIGPPLQHINGSVMKPKEILIKKSENSFEHCDKKPQLHSMQCIILFNTT